jgi:GT2 family glycosyltransferase
VDITVIIATYGAAAWEKQAQRAAASVGEVPVVSVHYDTDALPLGEIRNLAVQDAEDAGHAKGWLCFLDGDDTLAPGYMDAMRSVEPGTPWRLLAPALSFNGQPPVLFDGREIEHINPCVIGTLIHRTVFDAVGGFWDERAWEDWSLFRRAWLIGATVEHVPNAVYCADSNPDGRNSIVDNPHMLHSQICRTHAQWIAQR